MHPITIEFLAHDHIAELRRDANQPHVPEAPPAAGVRSRVRARIVTLFTAVGRRIHSRSVSPAR